MPVQLFPNWVVKLVRQPNLATKFWLTRPVEVFHVSPKMTKMEIKEYLIKLYNLPVSHVHTTIYDGKKRMNRLTGHKYQEADYKKAYVYLHDAQGAQRPRYHLIERANTDEYRQAWPVLPHRVVPDLPKKSERTPEMWPARNRRAQRQKPLNFTPRDSQCVRCARTCARTPRLRRAELTAWPSCADVAGSRRTWYPTTERACLHLFSS